MGEVTPRPWNSKPVEGMAFEKNLCGPDGLVFARVTSTDPEFAFLMKAVNSHDRMVEALKRIHDEADHTVGTEAYSSEVAVSNAKTIRRIAKDALATMGDET